MFYMVYNMFQNTYNGIQYTVYSFFFAGVKKPKEKFYYIYIYILYIYIIIYITCVMKNEGVSQN